MSDFHIRKPEVKTEPIACHDKGHETMDPIGYFLIRANEDHVEAGLCNYKDVNVIQKLWTGKKPQDVYRQIIEDLPEIRQDHCAYLAKELTRAWICMKLGVKFVQDGKMDGTFPEIEWLIKRN